GARGVPARPGTVEDAPGARHGAHLLVVAGIPVLEGLRWDCHRGPTQECGADSQSAASRLLGTPAGRARKSVPRSRDAAGTSACATWRACYCVSAYCRVWVPRMP